MTRTDADVRLDDAAFARPAETVGIDRRIASVADDCSVAWQQTGSGRDVLAIHGALMTLEDMWFGPVPALAQHFRVTAVDRPGHGHSTRRRHVDASPWRQATILHDFAQSIGLDRPILVGHSFGGAVALAYASLYPAETAGVVALAPICFPEVRLETVLFGPRAAPVTGEALTRGLGATSDKAMLPLLWRAMYLPQQMPRTIETGFPFALARGTRQMVAEGEDATQLIPALVRLALTYASCSVPTRFLGGTIDAVVNNATQGQMASRLMPNATFEWLPGLGHMLHHFQQERVVQAALSI